MTRPARKSKKPVHTVSQTPQRDAARARAQRTDLKRYAKLRNIAHQRDGNRAYTENVVLLVSPNMPKNPQSSEWDPVPTLKHVNAPHTDPHTICGMPILTDHCATNNSICGIVKDYVISNDKRMLFLVGCVTPECAARVRRQDLAPFCSISFVDEGDANRVAWPEVSILSEGTDPVIPYTHVYMLGHRRIPPHQLAAYHFQQFQSDTTRRYLYVNALPPPEPRAPETMADPQASQQAPPQRTQQQYVQQPNTQQQPSTPQQAEPPAPANQQAQNTPQQPDGAAPPDSNTSSKDMSAALQYLDTMPDEVSQINPQLGDKLRDSLGALLELVTRQNQKVKDLSDKLEGTAQQAQTQSAPPTSCAAEAANPSVIDPDMKTMYANAVVGALGIPDPTESRLASVQSSLDAYLRRFEPDKHHAAVAAAFRLVKDVSRPALHSNAVVNSDTPSKRAKRDDYTRKLSSFLSSGGPSTYNPQNNKTAMRRHAGRVAARDAADSSQSAPAPQASAPNTTGLSPELAECLGLL